LTHALFRALLFICAAGFIHSIGVSHDIRFMGGISVYIPFTSYWMVSNFALCDTPFLAGFYSRVLILEMQLYYLGFISRSLHVSGIRRALHQEYITVSAVIVIIYDCWIVKCMVAFTFKVVQNGWWSHY
jgi:NADH:ubiquinone oxidoreductase subunit 5 (subunit L)/multisubunit Na+/H+ antiporter MnhA subunit